jgi:DNA-binding PadR family transcriptional regulator
VFLKFKDEKLLKAIEEDFKLELSIKKVYEINDEGNKIRDDFITSIKSRKRPRENDISFLKSRTFKKQTLKSTRRIDALEY